MMSHSSIVITWLLHCSGPGRTNVVVMVQRSWPKLNGCYGAVVLAKTNLVSMVQQSWARLTWLLWYSGPGQNPI